VSGLRTFFGQEAFSSVEAKIYEPMMTSENPVLKIKDINLSFGGVRCLGGVSYDLYEGELLAIIGPNGAGKTALLNCISGFYRPQGGQILFKDRDLTRLPSHRIASLGVARTFQNLADYAGASTIDNLLAGRHFHTKENIMAQAFWFGPGMKEEMKQRRIVEEIIDFLEIEPFRYAMVGSLPYGVRKRIELGRALAMEPDLLLLDEPMAGMNLEEKEDIARFILDIHEMRKIPIILIEHDMGLVMDIAQRIVVLDLGSKIAEDSPEGIRKDPRVIKAYLGD
jgi:branched-chain amino acid transport system ATP-binding protein